MSESLHHISRRRRAMPKLESYPSKRLVIRLLDKLLIIIAIVGPLMALPQLIAVYGTHDADNISVISWSSWALMNLLWLAYGIVHKEKPIIITYILWFIVNGMMAIAPIIFR
ncbi:Uncharacterised protein [uncultured archaeon]|nr:Uncharacterised protein [uncultured archaeon]